MRQRVGREDLERSLSALRARVARPEYGVHGPGTLVWEVDRESALFLGAGRAALLQLAHPFVGQAVAAHSVTRHSPALRFQRTFRQVFRMVFGDLEEAERAARAVHAVHERIAGPLGPEAGHYANDQGYFATDVEGQVWVLATLWDTSLAIYERVIRPLSMEERERFYREVLAFSCLFGIEQAMPENYREFLRYMEHMLAPGTLFVTADAAEMARLIMQPDNVPGRLVRGDYGLLSADLLPAHLQEAFGLPQIGDENRHRVAGVWRLARRTFRHLPDRLRFVPAYVAARRRLRGEVGRDRLGELLSRLYSG